MILRHNGRHNKNAITFHTNNLSTTRQGMASLCDSSPSNSFQQNQLEFEEAELRDVDQIDITEGRVISSINCVFIDETNESMLKSTTADERLQEDQDELSENEDYNVENALRNTREETDLINNRDTSTKYESSASVLSDHDNDMNESVETEIEKLSECVDIRTGVSNTMKTVDNENASGSIYKPFPVDDNEEDKIDREESVEDAIFSITSQPDGDKTTSKIENNKAQKDSIQHENVDIPEIKKGMPIVNSDEKPKDCLSDFDIEANNGYVDDVTDDNTINVLPSNDVAIENLEDINNNVLTTNCHTHSQTTIVCLIIIVNIIFSGYFKYYFTYDHLFFTVRSPCHTVLPDPKSS